MTTCDLLADRSVHLDERSFQVQGSWGPGGVYDPELLQGVFERLEQLDNPILLDIGANTGSFALLARFHAGLECHAFEPSPSACEVLRENVRLNGLAERVHVHQQAITNRPGRAIVRVPLEDAHAGKATLGGRFVPDRPYYLTEVEATTIDRHVQRHGLSGVDLIKVDVEGAERDVLCGAHETLLSFRPELVVEYNGSHLAQCRAAPADVDAILEEHGYCHRPIGTEDLLCTPRPVSRMQYFRPRRVLVLRGNEYGFFSSFLTILDNLSWCEQHGVVPTIIQDARSCFWQPEGHRGSRNPWEYYFEPVLAQVTPLDRVDQSSRWKAGVPQSFGRLRLLGHSAPPPVVTPAVRETLHRVFRRYVRFKRPIAEQIAAFQTAHFTEPMIGVHIRGNRKYAETYLSDNPPLAWYERAVRDYAEKRGWESFGVFLATDCLEALTFMRRAFPAIVYQEVTRTQHYYANGNPRTGEVHTHRPNGARPAALGEEVLIDGVLLSRCQALVHYESNVAAAAAYMNPSLDLYHVDPEAPSRRLASH